MPSHHAESDTTHSLADLSAAHRDLLWVLSETGPSELLPLREALADYYTDGIDHDRVSDTLADCRERGFVTELPRDTATYRLTESARRALSARQAWQAGGRSITARGCE